MPVLSTIPTLVAVLGCLAVVFALIGRRIDHAPRCRKCKHDLTGLASSGAIKPASCPECGFGFDRRRPIVAGARRLRPRLLIVGSMAALAITIPITESLTAGPLAQRASWRLMLDLRLGPDEERTAVLSELLGRWNGGTLDSAHRLTLARRSVDSYAGRTESVTFRRPDLLSLSTSEFGVSPEDAKEIARQAIDDLAHDDTSGNAQRAATVLEALGPAGIPSLRDALDHNDNQARLYAATALIEFGDVEQIDRLVAALAANLYSDDIRSNATDATHAFQALFWRGDQETIETVADLLLETALHGDPQARSRACGLLYNTAHRFPPDLTLDLIIVAFAAQADRINGNGYHRPDPHYKFLVSRANADPPLFERMLTEGNTRQRFSAAVALVEADRTEHAAAIAGVLAPHLHDNNNGGDAGIAISALYHLGEPAVPAIKAELARANEKDAPIFETMLRSLRERPADGAAWYRIWGKGPVSGTISYTHPDSFTAGRGRLYWGETEGR